MTKERKSYIVSLGKCMMSVKDIVGSLVITTLPHLGDIMPSGGVCQGGSFFNGFTLPSFIKVYCFDLEIIFYF